MELRRTDGKKVSRRRFLGNVRWAPALYLPAPLRFGHWLDFNTTGGSNRTLAGAGAGAGLETGPSEILRLKPDYPNRSPLEEVLRLVTPGLDRYVTEKYAAELQVAFERLSRALLDGGVLNETLVGMLRADVEFCSLHPIEEKQLRAGGTIGLRKRRYGKTVNRGLDQFVAELRPYFAALGKIEAAEFEIVSLKEAAAANPLELETVIRYSLVGAKNGGHREERIGTWLMRWQRETADNWKAAKWFFVEETAGSAAGPMFADVTESAFGKIPSYHEQLSFGVDHWRTVLDGACGIDVYGNNGIAAGDFDGDGRDDLYICQPSGLPNRLYRNRGDGAFEDVTEKSGLGVLDATACAIFADFENKGRQDLLVVAASGPLLFLNQGDGKFALKPDAFAFAKPPQGTFTHAAVADYNRDGRLDIYFCLYSYYLGLDQYHYPSPYYDARNGPPNFLFHNDGDARFTDRTEAAGLKAENDRFSFACAWGDMNGSGGPDLYVANDFGRSNLYRNNGDGTFAAISDAAGVNVPGAGMSACWCDFDNDGKQDIYVSNMWAAAGRRVSEQDNFHAQDSAQTRSFYRGHAGGNSLYRNRGGGTFENVSETAGSAMGRWAWSADAWDFDHDGHSDLYIANGYISGSAQPDLSSFFWRQVVGNSPSTATPSTAYERGWNAINELIRSDHTWNGYERNTVYVNHGDGSFSDVSGITRLDFREDGRAFALGDFDGDGRQEMVLKNRNAPQVRILRNVMTEIGDAVSFRLRGTKSNRDAIGAAITVECGKLRQTKYVQAGSGFLSQHSKEIFFGLGKVSTSISAVVRWPCGLTQAFVNIPADQRLTIEEGRDGFAASPFAARPPIASEPTANYKKQLPEQVETWLIEPLPAPDFSLPDLSGNTRMLSKFRGEPVLICFWAQASNASVQQLQSLQQSAAAFVSSRVQLLCLNVDLQNDNAALRSFAAAKTLTLPVLSATKEVIGIYNLVYRYLFDRRRDLPIPCSFLVDDSGYIVKLYQGLFQPAQFLADAKSAPRTYEARVEKVLPFQGKLYNGRFARNDFTYGVAFFQHGYLEQAAESFRQVIATKPDNAEAYYNLGTLNLRKNDLAEARRYLLEAVRLRPDYPEAWNNLGMVAGQQNQLDDAVRNFQQSLALRPDYVTALLNLGNIYRRQDNAQESSRLLGRAIELEPENAEANYGLGMLYARQNDLTRASEMLQKAIALRPDYADAINNLGVLFVQQKKNAAAEEQFTTCIRVAPHFDQAYLNLARLYMLLNEKEKARQTLQALLKIQPQHKLAQQALEMLN